MSIEKEKRLSIQKKTKQSICNMRTIAEESFRVADVAKNSKKILDNLEKEFELQTQLDKTDIKFLFFAIALQCIRQYLLSNEKLRFKNDQSSSKFFKKYTPVSLEGPVPYDAFKKHNYSENTGISGANHRYTTLGHDPMLGWIFGTVNILTNTVTKNNFLLESYNTQLIGNEYKITSPTNIAVVFTNSVEAIQNDIKNLFMAVTKHALHLASDAFTKMGLPIPIINSFSPDLSAVLLKNGIDLYSVNRSVLLSSIINTIIAIIHSFYFDKEKYSNKKLYEVKTRKILSYSNLIASSSNILYTSIINFF